MEEQKIIPTHHRVSNNISFVLLKVNFSGKTKNLKLNHQCFHHSIFCLVITRLNHCVNVRSLEMCWRELRWAWTSWKTPETLYATVWNSKGVCFRSEKILFASISMLILNSECFPNESRFLFRFLFHQSCGGSCRSVGQHQDYRWRCAREIQQVGLPQVKQFWWPTIGILITGVIFIRHTLISYKA